MVNYKELARRLATSARDVPNTEENAKRIWEIWTQIAMFDPRDRFFHFSVYSGLPDGVTTAYLAVCEQYQKEVASFTDLPPKIHPQVPKL